MADSMQTYWNDRYSHGRIWGDSECPSAVMANELFKRHKSKEILVPGCGYGRNSLFFARQGFSVTAFDVSDKAIEQASQQLNGQSMEVEYLTGDMFDMNFLKNRKFDGIYVSNVLHLFLQQQRDAFLQRLTALLRPSGMLTFSVISTEDSNNFAIGTEIEYNTFMKHEGKHLHFFNEEEIQSILESSYRIVELQLHVQTESDPSGETEDLQLWFVSAKKR